MINVIKNIQSNKGITGFWEGGSMAVMKSTMSAGIFYTCLEFFTK